MKVYRTGKRGGGGIEDERTNGPQKQGLLVYESRKNQVLQVALAEVERKIGGHNGMDSLQGEQRGR